MISGMFSRNRILNFPGSVFLLGYFLIFPVLLVFVLTIPKGDIHLQMNSFHAPFLDVLMQYWTMLGDGLLLAILLLGLLMVSIRHFFTGLAAYVFGGLGAQLLKRLVFTDLPRPLKYFEQSGMVEKLYLVDGVDLHNWLSFPSGHTSTAFAVLFGLSLMTRSAIVQAVLFVLALGVGYSRVYLSQHFLVDVVGGSFLGLLAGWMAWLWIKRYKRYWMDRSIYNILR